MNRTTKIIILSIGLYSFQLFMLNTPRQENLENVEHLTELGFETNFWGFSPNEYNSKMYDDLTIYVDDQYIDGYQSQGYRVDGYVVSSSFMITNNQVQYRFEMFPEYTVGEDIGDSYILIVDRLINEYNRGYLNNPNIIEKCNQFITQVEPIVQHQFNLIDNLTPTEINPNDSTTYTEIEKTGDYIKVKPVSQIVDSLYRDSYIKDDYLVTVYEQELQLKVYNNNGTYLGSRYSNGNDVDYSIILNNDDINYQEIYGQDSSFNFPYLDDEGVLVIDSTVEILDDRFQEFETQLGAMR